MKLESTPPRCPDHLGTARRGLCSGYEVDGRTVILEAEDELVLRCGEASITLRRNGKITIRGVQVETRASGANKIRGGSVQIN